MYKYWMEHPKERVHLGNQSIDGVNIKMYIIDDDGRVRNDFAYSEGRTALWSVKQRNYYHFLVRIVHNISEHALLFLC